MENEEVKFTNNPTIKVKRKKLRGYDERRIDPTFEDKFDEKGGKWEERNGCRGINYLLSCVKDGRIDPTKAEIVEAIGAACWNCGFKNREKNKGPNGYAAEVIAAYGNYKDNKSYKDKTIVIGNNQRLFGWAYENGSNTGYGSIMGKRANITAMNIDITNKLCELANNNIKTV